MKIQKYENWCLGLYDRLSDQRVPISCSIEVTRRCPLNCVHCYNNLPLSDRQALSNEITYEEHCRILDEISGAGCLWLLYTGGEIFARPDFLKIYTYAKQKGLLITLFTNGALITPDIADYLTKFRPFSIEITIYGRTRETYEKITRIPGSYERCMRGIKLLMERGISPKLKTMAMTMNKNEIGDMKRFAEEDLGLEFRFDAMINPRYDCSPTPLNVRLSSQEVLELDLQDPKRTAEWKQFSEQLKNPLRLSDNFEEIYQCGGGKYSFAVDPYGMMNICVLSQKGSYNLRRGTFKEGWEKVLFNLKRKKMTRKTKCTTCRIKALCGMCPANGELEVNDAEDPVDFLCQVAHLRAYAFGIPIPSHGECEYCEEEY